MSQYLYWQATEDSSWTLIKAARREDIINEFHPPMMTVLSLDSSITEDSTAEDLDKIKYSGPFYTDFDSKDIEEATTQFNKYLDKLEEAGVNLDQVALYATGGKGYHALVPQEIFMERPPAAGVVFLPAIYKELAMSVYVDTLDLRVYSARKGRMFRMPNVLRKNGKFKVSITAKEARGMTPELYDKLTSAPRPQVKLEEPTIAINLEVAFSQAQEKVTRALKNRRKPTADLALIERLKGEYPDGMKMLMGGAVKEGVGFQVVATQLAITAHALGKGLDEFIMACTGLIEDHQGDGNRYNTPQKRKHELVRMYNYMDGNPCYSFSVGGLKSCIPKGLKTPQLDGSQVAGSDDGEIPDYIDGDDEDEDEEGNHHAGITLRMQVGPGGIFRKTDHGMLKICALGMTKPVQLVDAKSGDVNGYEVMYYIDGKPFRKGTIGMNDFSNKNNFARAISSVGGPGTQITDNEVQAVKEILRRDVLKNKSRLYALGQEGIDVIDVPDAEPGTPPTIVYVAQDQVLTTVPDLQFRLKSMYNSVGEMNCDGHRAPMATNDLRTIGYMKKFFRLNSPEVVARFMGWYLAAFLSPMIRKSTQQFPLLQVVGIAGTGKSQYSNLMMSLHYYRNEPRIFSAGSLTVFAMESVLNSSSSIPVIFDEMKPTEIDKRVADRLKVTFRSNYNGLSVGKGRIDRTKTKDELSVVSMGNRAPLTFMTEQLETQTAILDRCVIATMTHENRQGTEKDFDYCMEDRTILSTIGRACIDAAMRIDLKELNQQLNANKLVVREILQESGSTTYDRPAYNYAVVLTGLEFGKEVFSGIFGTTFDAQFDQFREAIKKSLSVVAIKNMSEISKVLSTLAENSFKRERDGSGVIPDEDYQLTYHTDGRSVIDLKVHNFYSTYGRYTRAIGGQLLFSTPEAFLSALSNHPSLISKNCEGNEEFTMGGAIRTYRFDLNHLYTVEGVREFMGTHKPSKVVPIKK